jgi:hypothetical protein
MNAREKANAARKATLFESVNTPGGHGCGRVCAKIDRLRQFPEDGRTAFTNGAKFRVPTGEG